MSLCGGSMAHTQREPNATIHPEPPKKPSERHSAIGETPVKQVYRYPCRADSSVKRSTKPRLHVSYGQNSCILRVVAVS